MHHDEEPSSRTSSRGGVRHALVATCSLALLVGLTGCEAANASCGDPQGADGHSFGVGSGGGGSGGGQYPGQYPGWVDPNDPYTSWDGSDLLAGAGAGSDVGDGPDANGCYACAVECRVADGAPMPNGGVVQGYSPDGHADACGVAEARAQAMAGAYLRGCRDMAATVKANPTTSSAASLLLHPIAHDEASHGDLTRHR